MAAASDIQTETPSGADFLPDFCAGRRVLVVLFITELVAVLLTLAVVEAGPGLWWGLFWLSLYLQWIGLCSAAGLCVLRRRLHDAPGLRVAALAYAMLLAITGVIAEGTYQVSVYIGLPLVFSMGHGEFLIRSLGVCAVVSALALRYFWLQHQRQREVLAAGQARYELLQARIRPHFLFNALNSIAELTASRPNDAETAVEDLATLFRANLQQADREIPLGEEIEFCRAYLRVEQLRLGNRLQVRWQIDPASESYGLPALILQPLIENAVRHGIECLPDGGCIDIQTRMADADRLVIDVCNPLGELSRPGSGEALQNIRQRLHWRYGEQADLITDNSGELFHARLQLPAKRTTT